MSVPNSMAINSMVVCTIVEDQKTNTEALNCYKAVDMVGWFAYMMLCLLARHSSERGHTARSVCYYRWWRVYVNDKIVEVCLFRKTLACSVKQLDHHMCLRMLQKVC